MSAIEMRGRLDIKIGEELITLVLNIKFSRNLTVGLNDSVLLTIFALKSHLEDY